MVEANFNGRVLVPSALCVAFDHDPFRKSGLNGVGMTAIRQVVEQVFENFDHENKTGLARRLREALEPERGESLPEDVAEILGRKLSPEEEFKIETLSMLIDEADMGDAGTDDSSKAGL